MENLNPSPAKMIEEIELKEDKLNSWERYFIDSIEDQLVRNRSLSAKQASKLNEIHKRLFD